MNRYSIVLSMLLPWYSVAQEQVVIQVTHPALIQQWQDIHKEATAHVRRIDALSGATHDASDFDQKVLDFVRDSFLDAAVNQPSQVKIQAIMPSMSDFKSDFEKKAQKLLKATIQAMFPKYLYKDKKATVRADTALSDQEQKYIQNRLPIVQSALKKFDPEFSGTQVPRIALCCSGGGGRAMVASLGLLLGADDIGLLDCAFYQVGLSGSSWLIGPWSVLNSQKGFSITDMKQMYKRVLPGKGTNLVRGVAAYAPEIPVGSALAQLTKHLLRSFAYDQPISAVSIWGSLVASPTLHDANDRFSVAWSEVADKIQRGGIPLPLCAAISQKINDEAQWFEFSPFEIGCRKAKAFIPNWALGRQFNNGSSSNTAPAMPLAYSLGIFGSAFEVDMKDLLEHIKIKNPVIEVPGPFKPLEVPLASMVTKAIKGFSTGGHILPTDLPNFAHGMSGSLLGKQERLNLMDAGIAFNIPLPLALRPERAVDMVVVLDCSNNIHNAPELRKAVKWCQDNNYKVPNITPEDTKDSKLKNFIVFNDPRQPGHEVGVPVIFYIPLYKRDGYNEFLYKRDGYKQSFDPWE
ncbi:MAG: hypothetical protein WD449_01950, partial [Candidatus Babeliales bacterium]